jgi:IS30 family transposase
VSAREQAPKVCTEDVKAALWKAIQPVFEGKFEPHDGMSVAVLAERAHVSTRTIYRVLDEDKPYAPLMNLEMADDLLTAADVHIWEVRVGSCNGEG